MLHLEHEKEIQIVTMASLYPIFHQEEMKNLVHFIVQVRELESRKQLAFEEVREQVKEDLHAGEHQKVMENWEDDLLQSAGFVLYNQVLKEMLAETKASQKT